MAAMRGRAPVTTSALLALVALLLLGFAARTARGGAADRDWWSAWRPAALDGPGSGAASAAGAGQLTIPLQLLLAVVLLGLLVLLGRRLLTWLTLRRAQSRRRAAAGRPGGRVRYAAGDIDADYADALAEAALLGVGSLRAAGASGTPGAVSDAVIAAWVRLESVAAGAGAARRTPDTAVEFAAGLLARRMVAQDALAALSELYSRARFSEEQLDATDGRRAGEALSALHRDLVGVAR